MERTRDFFSTTLANVAATLVALLCFGLIFAGAAGAATDRNHPKAPARHVSFKTVTTTPVVKGAKSSTTSSSAGVTAWPYKTLQLGVEANLGSSVPASQSGKMGFRYAYLAGGVNTGNGWSQWAGGVPVYISDSESAGMVPVFTYNQLQQSLPGNSNPVECSADLENLRDQTTMLAYYKDLKLFFQTVASASGPVIMQDEPDLWGCLEQAAGGNPSQVPVPYNDPNAAKVAVDVAASGMPELSGLPNNAAGFAQAILTLRDDYAPKVLVGYHDSYWGTGIDLQINHPDSATVQAMAATSIAFYRSLGANFNVIFSETHDRDAGYRQAVEHSSTSYWWTQTDFQHLGSYLGAIHQALGLPVVIWQIPTGTTNMNNTAGNYADNQVQTLLENTSADRALLKSYAADGISALLFGPSVTGDTPITSSLVNLMGGYLGAGAIPVS